MKEYQAFTFTSPNGIESAIHMPVKVCANGREIDAIAVWDTGATGSCISRGIAAAMGLAPIGRNRHSTAGGFIDCNDYMVDLKLLDAVTIPDVRVSDFIGAPGLDVLIGMDIITMGDLAITNANGITVMSFRMPSDTFHIDYVKLQQEARKNKAAVHRFKKLQKKH